MKEMIFKRTIAPAFEIGKHVGCRRFYVDIEYTNDGRLSLCGRWHSCGQNYDDLTDDSLVPSEGFEYSDIIKLRRVWKRWNLNDLRAGTPRQEKFVRNWLQHNNYDYQKVCDALNDVDLLFDNGYKYGSSWLKEDIPMDVIQYLFSLPAISGNSWDDIDPYTVDENEFFDIIDSGR